MYKQEKKAGFLQYFISIITCIAAWILCDIIGLATKNNMLADIIFLIMMMVIVYFIYVHYCAVFCYELTKKKLITTRKIGRREIKEEIPFSKIKKIYFEKPYDLPKQTLYMTVRVLNRKNLCYIIYDKGERCLAIDADNEFIRILKENING